MGYKQTDPNMTFAEASLLGSMEHNRSLKRLENISEIIDWRKVEEILMSHYTVGTGREGAAAYPPLMLLKGLLLQKWYRIDSDPELENQINDRISFKKFLGMPMDEPSPDHCTFSRFRSRLPKETMKAINHELLSQFASRGLAINEGIAIDARLVQSASHPISEDKLREERLKRETPKGNLDTLGKPMKFSRDIDSDWTVRNQVPHFGLKEHASVDTRYGFVSAMEMTPASFHDSPHLPQFFLQIISYQNQPLCKGRRSS